jgi:Tol biopolymer transport system component
MKNSFKKSLLPVLILTNALTFSEIAFAAGETISLGSMAGDQSAFAGTTWSSVSADGRYATLMASVGFIPRLFLYDRFTNTTKNLTELSNSSAASADLSASGRFVAFTSAASNLVVGDGNGFTDIFVQDIQSGKNELITKALDGSSANEMSYYSALSADGQFVAFSSAASNLVANDKNNLADAFVRNRKTGKTTRVSVSSAGKEGAMGIGSSGLIDISGDGRYVVFSSGSSNLVAGDDTSEDVFIHDTKTKTTSKISQTVRNNGIISGSKSPSISADGRFVAFSSGSSQLLLKDTDDFNSDIFVYDRVGKKMSKITNNTTGSSVYPSISADGRFVSFMSQADNLVLNDSNNAWDTFVHDLKTGKTSRVN